MVTAQSTADFLVDQMASTGDVRVRKMFGEYAVYCYNKVVALICDNRLFVKPTESGRAMMEYCEEAPPYPGAKPHLLIAEERWDDREWLALLIRKTADALPKKNTKTMKKN
jgi:TfoX/Sxy family transcriptional regulator of competence genes